MDIVDVNPFFYPFRGGIEHRLHETGRLLSEKGHKVTILTGRLPGTSEEEEMDGYRVVRLKSTLINVYNPPFISSKDVLETLRSMNPDIVNYNYRWAPSYNRDLAKYDGKKVFTYHNMWGEGIGLQARISEFNDGRFRKCLDTFDHIIAVSDFVRDDLLKRGYAPEHVTSIPTGLSSFPEKGNGEGDFILSLGRLVRTKGLDHMVEAMKNVDCKLIICGKGPDSKRIEKKIAKLGLGDKIELRGWVSEEEKEQLMGTCKFFVMPSLFESLGLAAIELMSHGRPLVYSAVNGLPETVRDGGISVPPKDPASIAAAANALLYDEDYREELGRNAAARSLEYNWSDLIPKIEDVFDKVLSGEYSRQK